MKIYKTITSLIAVTVLSGLAAHAQVSTQELYAVKFRAVCKPSDKANGHSSKMNESDLIKQYVGAGFTAKELKHNYALVYNPATDSIQVVNSIDGSLVSDVFLFEGGTNAVAGNQLTRFTFVFAPNVSNAIGSAVITERTRTGQSGNNRNRARISGKIQFTLTTQLNNTNAVALVTGNNIPTSGPTANTTASISTNTEYSPLSPTGTVDTNNAAGNTGSNDSTANNNPVVDTRFVQASAAAASSSDVQVCVGTFSAGKLFRPGPNNQNNQGNNETNTAAGASVPDNASTNSVSPTNSLSTTDQRFITEAAQAGLLEIQLGTLAAQNSTNQDVTAYAQTLIQDHTQSNTELAQIAAQNGVSFPTALDPSQQNTYDRLARLQGRQFDRAFASEAVTSHRQTIQLYQNESSRSGVADLRTYAANNLATLQLHLTEAQQLQGNL